MEIKFRLNIFILLKFNLNLITLNNKIKEKNLY